MVYSAPFCMLFSAHSFLAPLCSHLTTHVNGKPFALLGWASSFLFPEQIRCPASPYPHLRSVSSLTGNQWAVRMDSGLPVGLATPSLKQRADPEIVSHGRVSQRVPHTPSLLVSGKTTVASLSDHSSVGTVFYTVYQNEEDHNLSTCHSISL